MRLRPRLFLWTALLVLALTGVQWWLHLRQLTTLERELGVVATSVGEGLLKRGAWLLGRADVNREVDVHREVVTVRGTTDQTKQGHVQFVTVRPSGVPTPATGSEGTHDLVWVQRFTVRVEGQHERRMLVVRDTTGDETAVPIPVTPAADAVRASMHQALLADGLVLLAGLLGAAVLAHRVARPLQRLAAGAEALAEGDLGTRVPAVSGGEVGELERAFNHMSERLAELEEEREQWRRREHLAQLGDVARGLAHTLRNPLNTLGLAVEELLEDEGDRARLADAARAQITRVDRWLRSFMAVAAGQDAEPEEVDLGEVVQAAVLESVQQGARIECDDAGEAMPVRAVPVALRAALASLLDNAVAASPEGEAVTVRVAREGGVAVVTIADRGPGLSEEVRRRLFAPHTTTKTDGAGMGLFLARQLITSVHRGELELVARAGGGTAAVVRLPLTDREAADV